MNGLAKPTSSARLRILRVVAILGISVCSWHVGAQAGGDRPPPPGGGNGERRGPPPEMIEACVGKQAGSACSAVGRQGHTVNGTCMARPNATDEPLACRPEHPPGPKPNQGQDPAGPPDGQETPSQQANSPQPNRDQFAAAVQIDASNVALASHPCLAIGS